MYFVYQEWEIMREPRQDPRGERVENVQTHVHASLSFASKLQEARIRSRLTTKELAEKCDIPSRKISLYENGSEVPTEKVMKTLASHLEM